MMIPIHPTKSCIRKDRLISSSHFSRAILKWFSLKNMIFSKNKSFNALIDHCSMYLIPYSVEQDGIKHHYIFEEGHPTKIPKCAYYNSYALKGLFVMYCLYYLEKHNEKHKNAIQ